MNHNQTMKTQLERPPKPEVWPAPKSATLPVICQWKFSFPPDQASNSGMYLEEIVKSLAINTQMFQQETRVSIQNLETQISHLASSVRNIETNRGKLPSQLEINPRQNASAMTLRSGKEV